MKFGDSVAYSPQATIGDVFAAVQSNLVTYGLVPFENSTFGSVQQTLDSFISNGGAGGGGSVKIRADTFLPIHHCLLTNAPALSAIKRVYTHPEVKIRAFNNIWEIATLSHSFSSRLTLTILIRRSVNARNTCQVI